MKDNEEYNYIENMLINYKKNLAIIRNLELEIEGIKNDQDDLCKIHSNGCDLKRNFNKKYTLEELVRIKRSKEIEKDKVDNWLTVLNTDEVQVLTLRYFKELTFKEIAHIICKSEVYIIIMRKRIILDKLVPLIKGY